VVLNKGFLKPINGLIKQAIHNQNQILKGEKNGTKRLLQIHVNGTNSLEGQDV
jgi:hypothetical protein